MNTKRRRREDFGDGSDEVVGAFERGRPLLVNLAFAS
jgi:hypothetical protein